MAWLNYHHLHYFWTVARLGSVTAAAAELRVAQPTVSGQIRELEKSLGEKLFTRVGRGLTLTATGRTVLGYAEEIFSLGRELQDSLHTGGVGRPQRFVAGVAASVPKILARQLLSPALQLPKPPVLVCRQGSADSLLAQLAAHSLDLVITDTPVGPSSSVRAFNHLLGDCGVIFVGPEPLATRLRGDFPRSLSGAPIALPGAGDSLRRSLTAWFDRQALHPIIALECDDSALLKSFCAAGVGIIPIPDVAEDEVLRHYGLHRVGAAEGVRESFYAVTLERRVKHGAVRAICAAARVETFHEPSPRENR